VLGEADQFHPLGYPYDSAPPAERAPLDLDANPTLDDVLEVRAERTGLLDTRRQGLVGGGAHES
jgi:hypothetical protein